MKVVALMMTCGRHSCCERSLKFFLDQDYEGFHDIIIYQNSEVFQELGDFYVPSNKTVTLINNNIDYRTGKPFTSLGAIYNNAIHDIPEDADVVIFWDDDDIFLPNHITKGVDGLRRAYIDSTGNPKFAYKPYHSYFRTSSGITLAHNTLEPSIFVNANFIKEHGFHDTTSNQHLKWVDALVRVGGVYQDPEGTPTLCYNWGDTDLVTYKTSGIPDGDASFKGYRKNSQDHGDGIVTPISDLQAQYFYNLFNLN